MLPISNRSPGVGLVIRVTGVTFCVPDMPLEISNRTTEPSGVPLSDEGRLATHSEPAASNTRFPGLSRAALWITKSGWALPDVRTDPAGNRNTLSLPDPTTQTLPLASRATSETAVTKEVDTTMPGVVLALV